MSGLIQQLVEEMKDIPKLKWKDSRIEPPDTTKMLLVMDFNGGGYLDDLAYFSPTRDDKLRKCCEFKIAEYSECLKRWVNRSNEHDVKFDWYIEIDIIPSQYEIDDGLLIMKKEFQEQLDKKNESINREYLLKFESMYRK